jgi:L-ascorbate metabolism protein UlaG (beta-lactamase superfamily)
MCFACAAMSGVERPQGSPFPDRERSQEILSTGVRLRWTGVAGLRFDVDGRAVAFDPFVTRPGLAATLLRRPRVDDALVRARYAGLDAVFVGHTHYDHAMDLPAVADASPEAIIHGSRVTIELCRRLGIPAHRLVEVQDGEAYDVGPFRVTTVASEHGIVPLVRYVDRIELPRRGLPWTPFRYPRGDVFAWRLDVGGATAHVQGSAGIDDEALAKQGEVDALFACLAARHGTPEYLKRLGARLRPKVLLPIHHDDFFRPLEAPPRPVKTLDWPGFLADADAMHEAHGTALHLLPFDGPVDF